jgi:branched-chain amino acid transport system permease protein
LGTFTLAMVTLGYTLAIGQMLIGFGDITGGADGLGGITMPKPFDSLSSYYWFVGLAVLVAYAAWWNLAHSPFGRACHAIREKAVAASALGIDVYRVKLTAFVVSGVFGSLAGGLYAPLVLYISPDSFGTTLSVLFLLMVVIGGAGTALGPILGTIILFRLPLFVQSVTDQPGQWSLLAYGLVLLASVRFLPEGLVKAGEDLWDRLRSLRRVSTERFVLTTSNPAFLGPMLKASHPAGLVSRGLTKRLGGILAVDNVDLQLTPGSVHALIGPNGAGKTTLINLISGFVGADSGSVTLGGKEITTEPPYRRARNGLARTFQTPLIVEGMSCLDNLLLAGDSRRKHGLIAYLVGLPGPRAESAASTEQAEVLLNGLGLGTVARRKAGELPQGARRMIEIARVVAMEARVLLMDEPASGLDPNEARWVEEFIAIARDSSLAVLLIEHNVELVMRTADVVTVQSNGAVIAHGLPDLVRHDAKVIDAFLGDPVVDSMSS